ncbi:MAG: transporter ATP-binding protein [Candidatus Doudnabacteria bacterium]|nr:transporter ATP-binding protein [Candidatus Doudnabacteria bacterium]
MSKPNQKNFNKEKNKQENKPDKPQSTLISVLKPYTKLISILAFFAVVSSAAGLVLPKIISHSIDHYVKGAFHVNTFIWQFGGVAFVIFAFTYFQSIMQTFVSEKVAKDMRENLAAKISRQSFAFIEEISPGKILTNLTSDIDSVKTFVAQAIVSIVSSIIVVIGASILLLSINWKLALAVIAVVPMIGAVFFIVLQKVRTFMINSREVIDRLNKVINESILGSALIRVLNSQQPEFDKFVSANTQARNVGFSILRMFAGLIPAITFLVNMATLIIVLLGGHFVIARSMTLGDFTAFNTYLSLMIFPILVIGIMSNVIAQATASYSRIGAVLDAPEPAEDGLVKDHLKGEVSVKNITLAFAEKKALKDVSFTVAAGTKTAIIGPTAAGKTQLLYLLTGLIKPTSGEIEYDSINIEKYQKEALHNQVGFVFQDSIIFNLTLRENIAFNTKVTDQAMQKAIDTAELHDFIDSLPERLETIVSERGTSLSGGQKQRIMLARALALNPKVLLLDDFTARVDNKTEQKILANVARNYPGITLISVTQKISSIEQYDQVILLMEGEVLAAGTHQQLMQTSPEYVQIYNSQRSTNHYE